MIHCDVCAAGRICASTSSSHGPVCCASTIRLTWLWLGCCARWPCTTEQTCTGAHESLTRWTHFGLHPFSARTSPAVRYRANMMRTISHRHRGLPISVRFAGTSCPPNVSSCILNASRACPEAWEWATGTAVPLHPAKYSAHKSHSGSDSFTINA